MDDILEGIELDDELKAQITERVTGHVDGLAKKKNELLGKLAKEKESNRSIIDKLGISGYDEIDGLLEKLESSNKANDTNEKTERELKQLQRQIEEAKSEKDLIFNQLSDSAIKSQIKSDFLKAGVKPEMVDALTLSFINNNNFSLVKDESNRFIPLSKDGLSPSDKVAEWAKTEESKIWRSAPVSMGGGSQGSSGKGQGKMSVEEIGQISDQSARLKALKENGYL